MLAGRAPYLDRALTLLALVAALFILMVLAVVGPDTLMALVLTGDTASLALLFSLAAFSAGLTFTFHQARRAKSADDQQWHVYQAILGNIQQGIAYYDAEQILVFSNPAARRNSQLAETLSVETELDPHNLLAWDEGDGAHFSTRTTDGRTLDTRFLPLASGGTLMVQTDLTQQQKLLASLIKARQRAETASKEKSDYIASMSHELRTPLNAILGFAEIIRDRMIGDNPARYSEYAADIHVSGRHLLEVINGILDVTKLELGHWRILPEMIDLRDIVSGAIRITRLQAEQAGLCVAVESPDEIPRVAADAQAMRQVILNLLSNSIKFTPQGGEIRVSLTVSHLGLEIKVSDNGCGVDAGEQLRLFQPFARTTSSFERAIEGSGLGLFISRRIMELHGGTLTLASTPGQGTVMTATLPPNCLERSAA